ncbi:YbaB/EbfC family nucleoid-associated protein [Micromonospora fiedleri]|uniref:YbaB/EbfC family nucleoid-associated protein n=1 Tax=Micromonospora fiedleri TaxID=1157498 RepID=A0ABS1UG01_9ACTN|nr:MULTISPECIES: YbaB/EbfC family nucleoid-associated protein [Micromonospora]MBL6275266.1 YbaB/EbfC family nucleoid-associated protein [Micromonospora fiedleri]WSK44065.1 YbaB/EbfC family nucleoid-associated protein [Micromonospora maris]
MALTDSVNRDANRALRARFDEVYGQYQQLRSGLDELQTRLAELRVTQRSDDGQVTATVGAQGELIAVDLNPSIYRDHDAKALSAKITATVRRAAAAATTATQDLVSTYLPARSGAADFLRTGDFGTLLGRADTVLRRSE